MAERVHATPATTHTPSDRAHAGRVRGPALVAVVVEIVLYATLPSALIIGPRLVLPVLGVVLLAPLALASTRRDTPRNRELRHLSVALVALIAVVNSASLVLLVHKIADGQGNHAVPLLLAALQIWLTNVISFGLIFWEMDRGGPILRARASRADLRSPDFRFSQDEDRDTALEVAAGSSVESDWRPALVDYLYVSCTNSSAFSPTDTMPLSTRAKALMALEATEALVLSLLVVAQAVSQIKS